MVFNPNWPRPDEQLAAILGRPGDLPTPGNNRWGKAVKLEPGSESYNVVNVTAGQFHYPQAFAFQLEFSLDDTVYTPTVPAGFPGIVAVDFIKSLDLKAGAFREETLLVAGQAMPFCTFIAMGVAINVEISGEGATPLFVHAAVAPVQTVDCNSLTNTQNSPWNKSSRISVAADTVGVFDGVLANSTTRQVFIQNNTAVDLLLSFGGADPSVGPPEVSDMILPGGIHAIYETELGAFTGPIRGLFRTVGSATEFATFTRGFTA